MNKVEIITIGDEILIGQILDSNSAWMAQKLNNAGFEVYQITSVSDSPEHIINAVNEAKKRVQIILITGGLGPTKDDLTKLTLTEYFNTRLVLNKSTLDHITKLLTFRGVKMNQLNKDQALLPEECQLIINKYGTAAGMLFEQDELVVISMPGVPLEMKPMMEDEVIPELKKRFSSKNIIHKTIMVHNYAESELAEKISDWENNLPLAVKLAYLPSPGRIRLRLTMRGDSVNEIERTLDVEAEKLNQLIPNDISSFDSDMIEETIGKLLMKYGKTLSIAESCTGGNISHKLITIPGSSEYFKGSVVAYSNDVKINVLSVNSNDIESEGAVSKLVVEQMAIGVRTLLNTDYSIATSGIAGPGGGTEKKPVGTTWIAVSSKDRTISKMYSFGEHRIRNIEKSTVVALTELRKLILEGK